MCQVESFGRAPRFGFARWRKKVCGGGGGCGWGAGVGRRLVRA